MIPGDAYQAIWKQEIHNLSGERFSLITIIFIVRPICFDSFTERNFVLLTIKAEDLPTTFPVKNQRRMSRLPC